MIKQAHAWHLDDQPGCQEHVVKGRGLILNVPASLAMQMPGVAIGDRVYWSHGLYWVIGIESGGGSGGIGLVLRPEPGQEGNLIPIVLDGQGVPASEDIVAAQPLVPNANGDALPRVPMEVSQFYPPPLDGLTGKMAETLAQEAWLADQLKRVQYVPDGSGPAVPQPPVRGEPGFVPFVLPTMTTRSGEMPGMNNGCRTLYLPQFDAVQPGRPWWWWFTRPSVTGEAERAVYPVVRDGSQNIWVCHPHGGVKVQEFAGWVPLGPVVAVPDGTQEWQKIRDLETLLAGERLARKREWDSHAGACHHEGVVERLQRELTALRNTISRDRSEFERWDQRWTAARLELDKAGVPDWRPYTPGERAATASADGVTTDAGVMIPMSERVAMLVAQRDKERKAWAEAQMALDGVGVPGGQEVDTVSLADRVRMLTAQRDGWMAVCGKKDATMSALQAERDDLQAKLDEMKEDWGWKEVDRVRAILEKAGVYATTGAPSWRVLSTSEQLWELVADRDDLTAKLDEARTAIEEVAEKVTRAKEAREEQSYGIGCDSGAAIRPGDARAILRRSVPAATDTRDWDALPTARPISADKAPLDILDAKHWNGLPSIWQGQERTLDREAEARSQDSSRGGQGGDPRMELGELHRILSAAGCRESRPMSAQETEGLTGEEIAVLPPYRYSLAERMLNVLAELGEYRIRLGEARKECAALRKQLDLEDAEVMEVIGVNDRG